MANGNGPSNNQAFLQRGVDLAIRLTLLAIIVVSCYNIFRPFLTLPEWNNQSSIFTESFHAQFLFSLTFVY